MDYTNLVVIWLVVSVFIYYVYKNIKVKQSVLYAIASSFCLTPFVMCIKFSVDSKMGWAPTKSWNNLPYGTYPIWMFGYFSLAFSLSFLAKSIEYSNKGE